MTEEETISLLGEMMAPGIIVEAHYRAAAQRLWDVAAGFGLEEGLAEVALAYDLALQATRLDHADESVEV